MEKTNINKTEITKTGINELDIKRMTKDVPYVLDAFTERVREDPKQLMLVNPLTKARVSRRAADHISARLYGFLKARGLGKESRVMICLPRGEMPFLAVLGVLKAGAAFTVVEDTYAQERIALIRKDFEPDLFLDTKAWHEAMKEKPLPGYERAGDRDLCLAVYTSGTTGTPKGVLHEYGNISLNYLSFLEMRGLLGNKPVTMAMPVPLNFVAATKFMVDFLFWGDTIHVLPYQLVRDVAGLARYIVDQKIEFSFMPPSLFRVLPKNVEKVMKLILLGGEPAHGLYDSKIQLYNGYAMSESFFMLLAKPIDRAYDICPSGKPVFDWPVYLLDEDGSEVPEGQSGEICFPNPFFRGYANLPEKTREVMRGGLYHSGDLARQDDQGEYYIEGRADDMIKINGNRVEPAEIEAAAKRILGIDWCGARGFVDPDRSYLCLYYTADIQIDPNNLREKMGKYLPYYMIPTYFIHIAEIPLNANGKFTRKLLPKPDTADYTADYVAPRTKMEKRLCSLFEKILHLSRVGIKDDFYDLGGDSLSTIALAADLSDLGLTSREIFKYRTPARIAQHWKDMKPVFQEDPVLKEEKARKKAYPLTAFQLTMFNYQLYYPMSCMWNLTLLFSFDKDKLDVGRFTQAVSRVIDHHPIFRTVLTFNEDGFIVQHMDQELDVHRASRKVSEEDFEKLKQGFNKPFHLINNPLIRIRLYETPEKLHFLMISHHMVMDGVGINAILNNIYSAYQGEEDLPLDTFYSWLEDQRQFRSTPEYEEAKRYFDDTYGKVDWCNNLSVDHELVDRHRMSNDKYVTGASYLIVPPEDLLPRMEKEFHLSKSGFCAAIALLGLHDCEGKDNVMLNWTFSNRTSPASQAAAGMMLKLLPLGVEIRPDTSTEDVFRQVARRINEGIANCDCDWFQDHPSVYVNDPLFLVYEADILDMPAMEELGAEMEMLFDSSNIMVRRTTLQVMETEEGFAVELYYVDGLFDEAHRDAFHRALKNRLKDLGCTDITITEIID